MRHPILPLRLIPVIVALVLAGCQQPTAPAPKFAFQEGDILFQSLPHEPLVDTIEGSTHSPYSHCGIAHQTTAGWVVIEAIGPVKETPLADWIARGRDQRYAVSRLRPAYRAKIPAMIAAAQTFAGRPYDIKYELDDEKIYCSELVFKAFKAATSEELGHLQKLGELDWLPYRQVIETIEGGPPPLDRVMITPRAVAEASQVEQVRPLSAD